MHHCLIWLIHFISASDYANGLLDFPPSLVYGILCDGTHFEFFSFDGSTTPPTVSRGVFRTAESTPIDTLTVANYRSVSPITFILSLRPICETLFFFFLLAYTSGVEAYMERSIKRSKEENRARQSTLGWTEAHKVGLQAMKFALIAAEKAAARDCAENEITEKAMEFLQQRFLLF